MIHKSVSGDANVHMARYTMSLSRDVCVFVPYGGIDKGLTSLKWQLQAGDAGHLSHAVCV